MGDYPGYNCGTCRYSGDSFVIADNEKTECRLNNPGIEGFPIVNIKSWCWNGRKSEKTIKGEK